LKNHLLALIFCGILQHSLAQEIKIEWEYNERLDWSDFKGTPVPGSKFTANTNSGLSYSWGYTTRGGKTALSYQVISNFYPELSWVKGSRKPDDLLLHEQIHFDITEVHARKLRKCLDEYVVTSSLKKDMERMYQAVEAERIAMQQLYDKETAHSENKEAQERWHKYIIVLFEELNKYSL